LRAKSINVFSLFQGLSLSGGYEHPSSSKLLEGLKSEEYKNISENYYLCNDTHGSLATLSDSGMYEIIKVNSISEKKKKN
jgi:hypothetical protein